MISANSADHCVEILAIAEDLSRPPWGLDRRSNDSPKAFGAVTINL
ncbi:hypothetical protein [Synechococcus sp. BDU 130192]